jgi:hypothetical protein
VDTFWTPGLNKSGAIPVHDRCEIFAKRQEKDLTKNPKGTIIKQPLRTISASNHIKTGGKMIENSDHTSFFTFPLFYIIHDEGSTITKLYDFA